jgi:hypothetical protein
MEEDRQHKQQQQAYQVISLQVCKQVMELRIRNQQALHSIHNRRQQHHILAPFKVMLRHILLSQMLLTHQQPHQPTTKLASHHLITQDIHNNV